MFLHFFILILLSFTLAADIQDELQYLKNQTDFDKKCYKSKYCILTFIKHGLEAPTEKFQKLRLAEIHKGMKNYGINDFAYFWTQLSDQNMIEK